MSATTGGPAFPHDAVQVVSYRAGMSLREYAAINLKVPTSGTPWLDEMIRESRRLDLAQAAMQGWASNKSVKGPYTMRKTGALNTFAGECLSMADAMLAEREKGGAE